MTNLDYLRTMSPDEIADWLYIWWLPKGQYAWNSSRGALVKLLNDEYGEYSSKLLFGYEHERSK